MAIFTKNNKQNFSCNLQSFIFGFRKRCLRSKASVYILISDSDHIDFNLGSSFCSIFVLIQLSLSFDFCFYFNFGLGLGLGFEFGFDKMINMPGAHNPWGP